MDREKRKCGIPVPEKLKEMLNEAQWQAVSGIKYKTVLALFSHTKLWPEILRLRKTLLRTGYGNT